MALQIKLFIVFLLVGFTGSVTANILPTEPTNPPQGTPVEDVCALGPPSFVGYTEVGTSWIKVTWTPVYNAYQYHIITRNFVSNAVVNHKYVTAATNFALIEPLTAGTTVYSEVRAICSNGLESPVGGFSGPEGIIILDLVMLSGVVAPNSESLGAEMLFETDGPITIPMDGTETIFRVTDKNDNNCYRNFKVWTNPPSKTLFVQPAWAASAGCGSAPRHLFGEETNSHGTIFHDFKKIFVHFTVSASTLQATGELYREGAGNDIGYKVQPYLPGFSGPSSGDRDGSSENTFEASSTLFASPNPFTNLLDVQIPYSTEENDVKISLYDLQGRRVLSQQFPGGAQIRSLSTEDLTPGLYLLRVDTGSRSETIKVMKTQ
ncbi:MAG: T9SS type A sorting domain-containing protein [Saprospiraceae bacterium]|nr:T9SS type A sorting domain-containing protein [Saprospiraceae bacterium]